VHGTIEIDPGLIRINMGYGYFCAFDADQLRRGNLNGIQYFLWQLWTDDLIEHRVRCAKLEIGWEMRRAEATGFFTHWVLEELRYHKNRIAELIVPRFDAFGPQAFPRKLTHAVLGDQSVLDWCERWEVHQHPMRSFLSTVDLWAPQVVAPGVASDDPDVRGSPPVREDPITEKYPLPARVHDALRRR
jgi:hypothetical protein